MLCNYTYVLAALVIGALYLSLSNGHNIKLSIQQYTRKAAKKIIIRDSVETKEFLKYTDQYSGMFQIAQSVQFVNGQKISDFDCIVDFNDVNFNVQGYYIIKKYDSGNNELSVQFYIEIYLRGNGSINTLNYLDKIKQLIQSPVQLCSVKNYCYMEKEFIKLATCEQSIYNGHKISLEQGKQLYMSQLFHPQINQIAEQIMQLSNKPFQQMGLLLHGPPGTGKSRFAFLTALMTQRHVVQIDLATFQKNQVYQILQRPTVRGKIINAADVVFVFDEFDVTIINLYENEQKQKKQIDQRLVTLNNGEIAVNIDQDQRRYSDQVTIQSLLDLIQGPIPLENAIFIATTNNLAQIQALCPALCRPGRLTPIYFGYAQSVTLQQISQHYYKQQLNISDNMIATVSTAEIIENTTKYDFNMFQQFISKNIKQCS